MIRNAVSGDAGRVCNIYNYYIENTVITFEETAVSEAEMKKRITEVTGNFPWLVYENGSEIAGYAYASKWKDRYAYRYSVEVTVYLDKNATGRGIGTQLYEHLLIDLRRGNYHSAIAGIALPNDKSVGLHEKLGFHKAAQFTEVGYKFNRWINVGYWELIL